MFTLELSNHDDSGSRGTLSFTGGEFSKYCTGLCAESEENGCVGMIISDVGVGGGVRVQS